MPCTLTGRMHLAAATAAMKLLAVQKGWLGVRQCQQVAAQHSVTITAAAPACQRRRWAARRARQPLLLPSPPRSRLLSAAQRRPAAAARRRRRRRRRGSGQRRQPGWQLWQAAAAPPRIQRLAQTRMPPLLTQVGSGGGALGCSSCGGLLCSHPACARARHSWSGGRFMLQPVVSLPTAHPVHADTPITGAPHLAPCPQRPPAWPRPPA